MKNLVSSYTRLACIVYIGEVRGEVGTNSHMCCVGTWVLVEHTRLNDTRRETSKPNTSTSP